MSKIFYNRRAAAKYAEKYAETYNEEYPFYCGFDCTNFISQVLRAGGIKPVGSIWSWSTSWFCNTNDVDELEKVAISWRAARFFRCHWGNERGVGANRAKQYIEMPAKEFIKDFDKYYKILQIGDVVQYSKVNGIYPEHGQVIHKKGFNSFIGRNDCLMAQHTINKKDVSFYQTLEMYIDGTIYVYIIA